MKIIKALGIIVIFIVTVMIIILSWYGLFTPVKITQREAGPYLLVYQKHLGDYKNVGPIMDKIYNDLKENYHIETTKGFGIYFDNPQNVTTDQLRSIAGCIIEGNNVKDLGNLRHKYGVKEYPLSRSIIAEFPYKGKISVFIGIFKVYPRLAAYITQQKHPQNPIMEIYDQPNRKIEYVSSIQLSKETFDSFLKLGDGK